MHFCRRRYIPKSATKIICGSESQLSENATEVRPTYPFTSPLTHYPELQINESVTTIQCPLYALTSPPSDYCPELNSNISERSSSEPILNETKCLTKFNKTIASTREQRLTESSIRIQCSPPTNYYPESTYRLSDHITAIPCPVYQRDSPETICPEPAYLLSDDKTSIQSLVYKSNSPETIASPTKANKKIACTRNPRFIESAIGKPCPVRSSGSATSNYPEPTYPYLVSKSDSLETMCPKLSFQLSNCINTIQCPVYQCDSPEIVCPEPAPSTKANKQIACTRNPRFIETAIGKPCPVRRSDSTTSNYPEPTYPYVSKSDSPKTMCPKLSFQLSDCINAIQCPVYQCDSPEIVSPDPACRLSDSTIETQCPVERPVRHSNSTTNTACPLSNNIIAKESTCPEPTFTPFNLRAEECACDSEELVAVIRSKSSGRLGYCIPYEFLQYSRQTEDPCDVKKDSQYTPTSSYAKEDINGKEINRHRSSRDICYNLSNDTDEFTCSQECAELKFKLCETKACITKGLRHASIITSKVGKTVMKSMDITTKHCKTMSDKKCSCRKSDFYRSTATYLDEDRSKKCEWKIPTNTSRSKKEICIEKSHKRSRCALASKQNVNFDGSKRCVRNRAFNLPRIVTRQDASTTTLDVELKKTEMLCIMSKSRKCTVEIPTSVSGTKLSKRETNKDYTTERRTPPSCRQKNIKTSTCEVEKNREPLCNSSEARVHKKRYKTNPFLCSSDEVVCTPVKSKSKCKEEASCSTESTKQTSRSTICVKEPSTKSKGCELAPSRQSTKIDTGECSYRSRHRSKSEDSRKQSGKCRSKADECPRDRRSSRSPCSSKTKIHRSQNGVICSDKKTSCQNKSRKDTRTSAMEMELKNTELLCSSKLEMSLCNSSKPTCSRKPKQEAKTCSMKTESKAVCSPSSAHGTKHASKRTPCTVIKKTSPTSQKCQSKNMSNCKVDGKKQKDCVKIKPCSTKEKSRDGCVTKQEKSRRQSVTILRQSSTSKDSSRSDCTVVARESACRQTNEEELLCISQLVHNRNSKMHCAVVNQSGPNKSRFCKVVSGGRYSSSSETQLRSVTKCDDYRKEEKPSYGLCKDSSNKYRKNNNYQSTSDTCLTNSKYREQFCQNGNLESDTSENNSIPRKCTGKSKINSSNISTCNENKKQKKIEKTKSCDSIDAKKGGEKKRSSSDTTLNKKHASKKRSDSAVCSKCNRKKYSDTSIKQSSTTLSVCSIPTNTRKCKRNSAKSATTLETKCAKKNNSNGKNASSSSTALIKNRCCDTKQTYSDSSETSMKRDHSEQAHQCSKKERPKQETKHKKSSVACYSKNTKKRNHDEENERRKEIRSCLRRKPSSTSGSTTSCSMVGDDSVKKKCNPKARNQIQSSVRTLYEKCRRRTHREPSNTSTATKNMSKHHRRYEPKQCNARTSYENRHRKMYHDTAVRLSKKMDELERIYYTTLMDLEEKMKATRSCRHEKSTIGQNPTKREICQYARLDQMNRLPKQKQKVDVGILSWIN